eukprot:scaffold194834_cov20-Prasinocladus_malaysianus.AAC.1
MFTAAPTKYPRYTLTLSRHLKQSCLMLASVIAAIGYYIVVAGDKTPNTITGHRHAIRSATYEPKSGLKWVF